METCGKVSGQLTNNPDITIVGTVHERYTQPDNPNVLELWFPISSGMVFLKSCGMPMTKTEDFGAEADGSRNLDYCRYCYGHGSFFKEETMEQMIETCVPFMTEGGKMAQEQAREILNSQLPNLKRWKK